MQGQQGPAQPGRSAAAEAPAEVPVAPQAAQIRSMFDRIAGIYDLMNTVMTAGLHHRWRSRAADKARLVAGASVLDVATGTGDFAIELARRVGPDGSVVASDFSEAMLARARAKSPPNVRFEWGDALALPYPNDQFDAATVGFGARNFTDLPRGLAEMVRVVRPGGRVVVLEIAKPTRPPLSWFYRLWFDRLVPAVGRVVGFAEAYSYLPESVQRFLSPAALAAEMEAAGLTEITYVLTAGSIIAIHSGTVL
jgi:demethylmenaquinone methyltransferase/2-methoxy-6-polyprenyl-1,4-benzoquinol methylase